MSVTDLLATRDCVTVGCPNEADGTDQLCRYCRGNRPRPKPVLRLVHSRRETTMAGYTGANCKRGADHGPPVERNGIYAGLCGPCKVEKMEERLLERQRLAAVPGPDPEPEPVEAGPLLEAVLDAQPAYELAQEAAAVVKDRMGSYGPPDENHGCTAAMFGAYLERRRQACARHGVPFVFDAEDVCWFNVIQKVSREANVRAADNRLDVMGFAINAELAHESGDAA